MSDERIMTLHPQGKKGTNILLSKYQVIKDFILKQIEKEGEISYEEICDRSAAELKDFDGKPIWYIVSVKLDLEARGVIERVPKTSPHRVRMVG